MAEVTLRFPEVKTVLRSTGEAVVELRQNGDLVGEINFTKLLAGWLEQIVAAKRPGMKALP
jgi:hypothetical protein